MATLAQQVINRAGLAPSYAAANAGGDAMPCGSGMFLHAKNTGGAPITITLAVPPGASGYPNVSYGNVTVTVPATTGDRMIGPISGSVFQDPITGLATISYSGVAGLTVAALQLSQP